MRRLIGTVVAVLVIAGTVFFFLARTDWARAHAEQVLSKRLGMEMQIQAMRIGWPYVLALHDAVSVSSGPTGEPRLRMGEVRIGLGVNPRWRVTVRRAGLRLPADERAMQEWPPALRRLRETDLFDMDAVSQLVEEPRARMTFTVEEGRIEWLDDQGVAAGYAHGVTFQWKPVRLPTRAMHWHGLAMHEVELPDGTAARDVRREWLLDERLQCIELPMEGTAHFPARPDGTGAGATPEPAQAEGAPTP